jgi:arylsulfatase A-like enzyme
MNRRDFLVQAAAAAGSVTLGDNVFGEPVAAKRPNLVYVLADQLRYSSCGYAGDAFARTPHMDKLASEGASYYQAISSTPVCAPYRASLMTGKYQSSTGMVINELRMSPEHECFGHVLTRAGYQTAYIGKWHLWAAQQGHHDLIKNGFTPPGPYRLGFDDYWAAYNFNHIYNHAPYFLNNATPYIRQQYEPDSQTDAAIEYLKGRASKPGSVQGTSQGTNGDPFALFLSWGPPHYPWGLDNVPAEYAELFRNTDLPLAPNYSTVQDPYADDWQKMPPNYDQGVHEWLKVYYAQVANLDWNLGRLLSALEDAGMAENTIFVFTSDHGEMFGSHGRQSKLIFYEEAARVPFLMRWPAQIRANTKTDALLGTPDVMPTLLSMLGLPVPRAVEGRDLSGSVLSGSGLSVGVGNGKDGHEAAHMQGMGATAAWVDGSEWRALRDHEYTYAIYHRDGKELLFDHGKDPFQMKNLAEDRCHAKQLKHYRQVSELWRRKQGDTFEACTWYEPRWTQDRNITNTARGVGQNLDQLREIQTKWFPDGVGERSVGVRAGVEIGV